MTAIQKYTFMRQAGFSHIEAERFINNGVQPNLNTELKRQAIARVTQGETNGRTQIPVEHLH